MPERGQSQCRGLDDLAQRGQDTNFYFDAVSCRFTGFTRDRKYVKNHAKHHRIAIFTADNKKCKIETETFVGCYRFTAWPDNTANDKSDKPKPKGVT
jgi:hypothetical protein